MKNVIACVVDTGNWVPIAEYLGRYFKKVYYYRPASENGYMKLRDSMIGEGYDNVECLDEENFWDSINEIGFFVFTDCVYAGLQQHLKSLGKLVWGAGETSWMEQDRFKLRAWQEKEGMSTPEFETITGVEKLKDIPEDTFIKANNYVRGDMETIRNYDRTRSLTRKYELLVRFGGYADKMKFMVENKIEGIELGVDSWTVDGNFPKYSLYGVEIKDKGYLGRISQTSLLPTSIKEINGYLAKVFKAEKTRSTYSNEIRVDKNKKPFLTDMTTRFPLPPYQLHLFMWSNFALCMYKGAQGELIDPVPIKKYGAVLIISSSFAEDNWLSVKIPEKNKKWVLLMNSCRIDNQDWILPINHFSEIGAVVGIGDDAKTAVENCKLHAEGIEADSLEIDVDSLDYALQEFNKI